MRPPTPLPLVVERHPTLVPPVHLHVGGVQIDGHLGAQGRGPLRGQRGQHRRADGSPGWQGCGVGTRLLQAARARAAGMGYRELVGEMLVVNAAVLAAVRRVFPLTRVRREGSELTITMVVDGASAPPSPVEGLVA